MVAVVAAGGILVVDNGGSLLQFTKVNERTKGCSVPGAKIGPQIRRAERKRNGNDPGWSGERRGKESEENKSSGRISELHH